MILQGVQVDHNQSLNKANHRAPDSLRSPLLAALCVSNLKGKE